MMETEQRDGFRSRRSAQALVSLPFVFALVVGACGTTDKASKEPLPLLRTTTSTSTIPGSTIPEGQKIFYKIKRGDTLAGIADGFLVTVQSIIDLNGIENPDNVPAGITIEIPTDILVVDEIPDITADTTG
jgi:LysM repeat protein